MKTCIKCSQAKELDEFYKHSAMADGRLNKCKECTRKDVNENRAKNTEYYRAYDRLRGDDPKRVKAREAYQQSERGKEASRRAAEVSRKRHAIKIAARNALLNAVRDGRVQKFSACMHCGSTKNVQGHHTHYDAPLAVYWLCAKCHAQTHKEHRQRMRDEAA